jgi:hypothetical protein
MTRVGQNHIHKYSVIYDHRYGSGQPFSRQKRQSHTTDTSVWRLPAAACTAAQLLQVPWMHIQAYNTHTSIHHTHICRGRHNHTHTSHKYTCYGRHDHTHTHTHTLIMTHTHTSHKHTYYGRHNHTHTSHNPTCRASTTSTAAGITRAVSTCALFILTHTQTHTHAHLRIHIVNNRA